MNWPTRYKIIGGIARGLLYLHEDSRLKINILLDAEMNAKIDYFGLAGLIGGDQTHGKTDRIAGA